MNKDLSYFSNEEGQVGFVLGIDVSVKSTGVVLLRTEKIGEGETTMVTPILSKTYKFDGGVDNVFEHVSDMGYDILSAYQKCFWNKQIDIIIENPLFLTQASSACKFARLIGHISHDLCLKFGCQINSMCFSYPSSWMKYLDGYGKKCDTKELVRNFCYNKFNAKTQDELDAFAMAYIYLFNKKDFKDAYEIKNAVKGKTNRKSRKSKKE